MSLRLLPAIIMDNDEDDDGNFTKWMSSYWGHGAESGHSRDRKRSFRRPAKTQVDRRGSLPTVSQLDAMKLNRLHAATMAPTPSHLKTREEKGEVRPHQRARRASSDDNSRPKSAIPENRITTIPELTESFEKRLYLRDKRAASLNDDDKLCLICHEDMRKNGGTVQELHCTHRFHKEAARRLGQCRPRSSSEAADGQVPRFSGERRRSVDGPISVEKEQHTPRRQLSLRRHR
ncbi:leukemia NUP98 fusion partner 1 isoform X1 [Thunnus albacares]|uniref:leukemia NUP98 fusion partner 1 isoform X1 n=1 Tax=Thunnus albacares TaxID=8236 RepID=UPI001CF688B7|nr:leukemia NUP98 fusion partner 1 isoform X1 [Thunnus albacares]XP_044216535.1 leukemia NUP98 fusion partner 1 isoform X1 [Thunnus albacares]